MTHELDLEKVSCGFDSTDIIFLVKLVENALGIAFFVIRKLPASVALYIIIQ